MRYQLHINLSSNYRVVWCFKKHGQIQTKLSVIIGKNSKERVKTRDVDEGLTVWK